MPSSGPSPILPTYEFAGFRLDPNLGRITRQGKVVPLAPKEFDTLLVLLERAPNLVSKEDLLERVWPGTFVGDGSLAKNISVIRRALGEDLIETVPRRGYRFRAEVSAAVPDRNGAVTKRVSEHEQADPAGRDVRGSRRRLRYAAGVMVSVVAISAWALTLRVTPARTPHHVASAEAQTLYARGRQAFDRRNIPDMQIAVKLFDQAIAADAQFAPAYSGLADIELVTYDLTHDEGAKSRAQWALKKAHELAPEAEETLTSAAMLAYLTGDAAAAEEGFKKAIAANPRYALAHYWYALVLNAHGRRKESLKEYERAMLLDPSSIPIRSNAANVYQADGQYEKAVTLLHEVISLDPGAILPLCNLGIVEQLQGNHTAAAEAFHRAAELDSSGFMYLSAEGYNRARAGQREAALAIVARLEHNYMRIQPLWVLPLYAALGDTERVRYWLRKGVRDGSIEVAKLRIDPQLQDVWRRPEMQAALSEAEQEQERDKHIAVKRHPN